MTDKKSKGNTKTAPPNSAVEDELRRNSSDGDNSMTQLKKASNGPSARDVFEIQENNLEEGEDAFIDSLSKKQAKPQKKPTKKQTLPPIKGSQSESPEGKRQGLLARKLEEKQKQKESDRQLSETKGSKRDKGKFQPSELPPSSYRNDDMSGTPTSVNTQKKSPSDYVKLYGLSSLKSEQQLLEEAEARLKKRNSQLSFDKNLAEDELLDRGDDDDHHHGNNANAENSNEDYFTDSGEEDEEFQKKDVAKADEELRDTRKAKQAQIAPFKNSSMHQQTATLKQTLPDDTSIRYFLLPNETGKADQEISKAQLKQVYSDRMTLKFNDIWVNSTHTRAIAVHYDKLTFLDYSLDPLIQNSGRKYTFNPANIKLKTIQGDQRKILKIHRFAFSEDGMMLVVTDKHSIGVAKFNKPFEFLYTGTKQRKLEAQINESAHTLNACDKDTSFNAINKSHLENQGLKFEAVGVYITPVKNYLVLVVEQKEHGKSSSKSLTQIYRSHKPLDQLIVQMNKNGGSRLINLEDLTIDSMFQRVLLPSESGGFEEGLIQIDRQLGNPGLFIIRRDCDGMPFVYNADDEEGRFIEYDSGLRNIQVAAPVTQSYVRQATNKQSSKVTQQIQQAAKMRTFDKNAESAFYYQMDELLFIKYEDRVQIYKKLPASSKENEAEGREESWIEYPKKPMIRFDKKVLQKHQILKVYEDYIYFLKTLDRMTVKMMNIQTGKIDQTVKLLAIAQPYHQFQYQPHILTANGFENVFFPKPLVSYTGLRPSIHLQDKKNHLSFLSADGLPLLPNSIKTFEKQNGGMNSIDQYLNNQDYKLIDYIPERRIAVFTHSQKNKETKTLLISFESSEIISTEFDEKLDNFLFRGVLMEQKNSSFAKQKYYQLFFSKGNKLKVLQIDVEDVTYSSIHLISEFNADDVELAESGKQEKGMLAAISNKLKTQSTAAPEGGETEKPVTNLQFFYCREENEIVVSGKIKSKEDYLVVLKLQYDPEDRQIVVQEKISLIKDQESPLRSIKVMLYSKRMLYYNDIKSGTFTVQPLDENFEMKKDMKAIFSQVRGLEAAVKLPSCTILYTEDDMLYITNQKDDVINVKSVIKNLYTGDLVQDRSQPGIVYCIDYVADRIQRVNLFNFHPTSIPYNLMIKDDLYTKYDDDLCSLFYYESIDKSEDHQILSHLKLRTATNSILDFRRQIQRRDLINDQPNYIHTVQEFMEEPRRMAIRDVLSYNVINRKHFFTDAIELHDSAIMDNVMKKLEVTSPEKVPFLFPGSGILANKRNVFGKAILKNKSIYVKQFISLMTTCDPKGLIYQKYVDFKLTDLLNKRIDIKSYFCSSMPIHKIPYNKFYVQYSEDDRSLMIPCNADNIQEIEKNFKRFIEPALTEYDGWFPCCRKRINPDIDEYGRGIADRDDEEREAEAQKREMALSGNAKAFQKPLQKLPSQSSGPLATNDEEEKGPVEPLHEIEYLVINLKAVFTSKKKKLFMQQILQAANNDITYLDIPILQGVVDFKWSAYTKEFFVIDLIKTVIFVMSFIIDIITLSPDGWEEDSYDYYIACIVTRSICGVYMLDFFINEMRQLYQEGFYTYLTKDIWNFCDISLFSLYCAYAPVSFIYKGEEYTVKVIQCAILMFISIKVNFYLRIFDKFGYLVQMVTTVFYDLRYFILYFFIILSFFSIQISIYMKDVESHEGIGPFMYFVMVLRTSLGDNDIDEQFSEYKVLFWVVWTIIMLVSNIVLMNFIIAVVGESYEACMSKMIAQSYKGKVDMIVEREQIMFQHQFRNKQYFPNYIIIRRPVDSSNDATESETARIQEISREVRHMADQISEIKQELRKSANVAREEASMNQLFVNDMREQMLCLMDFATKMSQANNIQIDPAQGKMQ